MSYDGESENGDEFEELAGEVEEPQWQEAGDSSARLAEGVVDLNNIYTPQDVNTEVFDELRLRTDVVEGVQAAWNTFLRSADSADAAGELVYAALFESSPSLQALFKTPRAVMAMRFMTGLNQIINNLHDPKALKIVVETLSFKHLDLEVTVPRVAIFRDAILELLTAELGQYLTKSALDGFSTFFNYVGGAYIYVRNNYTERLKILSASWATANKQHADLAEGDATAEEASTGPASDAATDDETRKRQPKRRSKKQGGLFKGGPAEGKGPESDQAAASKEKEANMQNTRVPTTYQDMFLFNAAVMGFGNAMWMHEVLASFDAIVTNASNSYRLQEECDMLSLRIASYKKTIKLEQYKAVMLASLRSLVPKDWDSAHEVAWTWLWENVERMLVANMGKPAQQQKALAKLWASMDEDKQAYVRTEVYAKFFTLAPAGQDFFKQSTTRLHFIADKIVEMTLEIYKEPKRMAEDLSALGLRHVGYGIPTELFGPFVTACVQVVRSLTTDDVAEEAFRWSLNLISRTLVRVIDEGSTIVMKAINANSARQLQRAVGCAPRGKRASWVLNVTVGTQSISPLLWAIETGSLEAAHGIIHDLLTIRADRDNYYYGMDAMFRRHPDIVKRLCFDAPTLLYTLFDGLVWRSRFAENGVRRVNYYVRHLLVDTEGNFSQALEWLTEHGDPKLICHPSIAIVMDTVWSRIAFRTFLYGKAWLLVTLVAFLVGTAALKQRSGEESTDTERAVIFACRCFIYVFNLGAWFFYHAKHMCKDIQSGAFASVMQIKVPAYLASAQDAASLALTVLLTVMLVLEPILHCWPHRDGGFPGAGLFTEMCPQASGAHAAYSGVCGLAITLYFFLTIDICAFSTRLSAFVLVCFRMLAEVCLFLCAMAYIIVMFAACANALDHGNPDFEGIHTAGLSLVRISLTIYDNGRFRELHDDPALFIMVVCYILSSIVFFTNLLIAQLNCSYQSVYEDMVGYARLNRGKIVVDAMASVPAKRWAAFIRSLRLDERVEFGEGDIGLAGAIPAREPASANIITVDNIRRFGGSTSPTAQWPDDSLGNSEEDRIVRLEKVIERALKRMSNKKHDKQGSSTANSASYMMSGASTSSGASHTS